jgi:hypothetical protein
MLDVFNIPGQQDATKIYYTKGSTDWQVWNKPRSCKFVWMMCIGAGAGGQTTGTTANGFGGGSGAVTRALFPANVLPDTLFVQPGQGAANTIGGRSFVSIASSTAAMNLICVSGNAGAGTGGLQNAESVATVTSAGLLSLGTFVSIAGIQNPSTATYTPTGSNFTNPGGNGGNNVANVGTSTLSVTLTPNITTPTLLGGTVVSAGGDGDHGVMYWKPLFSLGGAGGNGSNTGIGGRGGDGSIGSGGGGCGAGSVSGATGGRGGNGLVIITTF